MSQLPHEIAHTLTHFQQPQLVLALQTLPPEQQRQLLDQIQTVDFPMLRGIWQSAVSETPSATSDTDRPARARAPGNVVRQPGSTSDAEEWANAGRVGEQALRAGAVAIITVAGGQGTRLGFEHPKGMFPIGPVTDRTLFQVFAEQILARRNRYQAAIPWLIMTSDATHAETVTFFRANRFFGLDETSVVFFQQGNLPAIDAATGELLLAGPADLALSPDGHGGLVMALQNAGLIARMQHDGIQHLFYHQVDNPTAIIADPALIGFHCLRQSQLTTCVVCKTSPTERMGVLVDVDGHTEIIEYSELTPEQAAGHDESGQWIFWAGNTAIHVFDVAFLHHLTQKGSQLPIHVARKNVAFFNSAGVLEQPSDPGRPNAIKLERFIFDALPLAARTLIVEGDRQREFNPVKNKSGNDSAATSQAALNRIAHQWLQTAGYSIPSDRIVEISPLQALDHMELQQRLTAGILNLNEIRMK